MDRWEILSEHLLMPSDAWAWLRGKSEWSLWAWGLEINKCRFKSWSVTCWLSHLRQGGLQGLLERSSEEKGFKGLPCYSEDLGTYVLKQCFSNRNVYTNPLEILWKCRFWFSKSVVGPSDSSFWTSSQFMAIRLGPQITLWVAR